MNGEGSHERSHTPNERRNEDQGEETENKGAKEQGEEIETTARADTEDDATSENAEERHRWPEPPSSEPADTKHTTTRGTDTPTTPTPLRTPTSPPSPLEHARGTTRRHAQRPPPNKGHIAPAKTDADHDAAQARHDSPTAH